MLGDAPSRHPWLAFHDLQRQHHHLQRHRDVDRIPAARGKDGGGQARARSSATPYMETEISPHEIGESLRGHHTLNTTLPAPARAPRTATQLRQRQRTQ